jgi:hypothetical protein
MNWLDLVSFEAKRKKQFKEESQFKLENRNETLVVLRLSRRRYIIIIH